VSERKRKKRDRKSQMRRRGEKGQVKMCLRGKKGEREEEGTV
jgi:hypothetical protein